jgi:replicative DNA helicase
VSVAAEQAVLGSCLCSPDAVALAVTLLKPDHFEDDRHAALFAQISEMRDQGIDVDVVTVGECMPPNRMAQVGRSYLAQIAEDVPTSLHVQHYADVVKRDYYKRELTKVLKAGAEDPLNPEIRAAIKTLWEEYSRSNGKLRNLDEDLTGYYQDVLEQRMGGVTDAILTGYGYFDSFTGGVRPGQLITVAARTSRGKTTYMMNLADRFMMRDHRVLFFSAEMDYVELLDRIMAGRTKIPLTQVRGKLTRENHQKLVSACGDIYKKPLTVNDGGRLSLDVLYADIEAKRPRIVFVDYIQRFTPPPGANRAAFYSDIANELKSIAREKRVTIFAASQINRDVEKNEREPTLADLKESGGIEEASDLVLALHCPDKDQPGPQQTYKFLILKQRNGPLGNFAMTFFRHTVSFEELADDPEPGGLALA